MIPQFAREKSPKMRYSMRMSMGLALLTVLVIVIGISMASSPSGLQDVLPALLGFFNSYLIPFLLGIAFLVFIWNAIRFFVINGATDEGRENAKNLALYSLGAFIFVLSFWGIINIFTNGLGLDNCSNDVVPDYLSDDYKSLAPCTSPRPQPNPNNTNNSGSSGGLPPLIDT
ncbi:MAG: hypothetical protein RLZZ360_467 [Candidatus Parcubacteria bacterium]|jgi:hypothetical protein